MIPPFSSPVSQKRPPLPPARRFSRPAFFKALTAAFVFGGCLSVALPGHAQGALPDSLPGELTTHSGLNAKDGSRYQTFELQLRGGEVVRASHEGALSGAAFTLFDERQRVISGPHTNVAWLLAPRDGRYMLAVSGENDRAYGPFTLLLETVEVNNGGPLTPGEETLGVLSAQPPENIYTLAVPEAGLYRLSLDSTEFDAILRLSGEGLDMKDAGASGTGPRLTAYLPQGASQITVRAAEDSGQGVYVLRATRQELPDSQSLIDQGEIKPGTEITGIVGTGSAPAYTITVPEQGILHVRMRSSDVDSALRLRGPGVDLNNDDGVGDGFNARILAWVEPGEYTITPSSTDHRSGLFTLSAGLVAAGEAGELLQPGESVTGVLAGGKSLTTTLRITTAGRYRIELLSAEFDAYLRLQGDGTDQEDDDSAGGADARLDLHLPPGDYRLTGSAYGNEGGGRYLLSVQPLDD